jgi:hypothetical protein
MHIFRTDELRKSVDLGEEEEWDKSDGTRIRKEYWGTQHTVLLTHLTLFLLKKKPTFVSPLLCPITWSYFPIGKNTLLRAATSTDSLEATVPALPSTSPLSPTKSTLLPSRCKQYVPLGA